MPSKKRHNKNISLNFELPTTSLSKDTNLLWRKSLKYRKCTKTNNTDYIEDDTPKAFIWLMSSGAKQKCGGEEDVEGPKEKKIFKGNPSKPPLPSTQNKLEQQKPALHILYSESLHMFNCRVDTSMPIPLKGPKTSKTDPIDHLPNSKSKSKQPNSTHAEDPEAEDYSDYLTDSSSTYSIDSYEKQGKAKYGEMAEALPELRVKPKEILRAPKRLGVDVGSIRKVVGSIVKREILAEERRGVVERYREMMEGKRAVGGA
ncbi:hypothetical protein BGX38DRAFT_1276438 [Terfezia claveryi]|nr:hypothetical protein BGX38DRAFT_1276438 [Terfezia claveryi]